MPDSNPKPANAGRLRKWLWLLTPVVLLIVIWIFWAEQRPEQEAWLRDEAQARLQTWFPEHMQPRASEIGFDPTPNDYADPVLVVMVHGLDEPGGVFNNLASAVTAAGYGFSQFRYPNDQSIDLSTDVLAEYWAELPDHQPVVLVGHSMGGLVIRDFVTRWVPALDPDAAEVVLALLVGTPNQGSEWARLRVWLELRDLMGADSIDEFGLFAGLRDGTGAAKVDLRPGSQFLTELNQRTWPEHIPLRILGGKITLDEASRNRRLKSLEQRLSDGEWSRRFDHWLTQSTAQLGDGVVPIDSLPAPGAPAPDIVVATHRGLLRNDLLNDGEPPGIEWALSHIEQQLEP
ncbi:MAG: alpha/beta fold hydrolase [Pseudomonadota bacterium]